MEHIQAKRKKKINLLGLKKMRSMGWASLMSCWDAGAGMWAPTPECREVGCG